MCLKAHVQPVRQPLKLQAQVLRLQGSGSALGQGAERYAESKQTTHSHTAQLTFHSLVLCADVGMFQLSLAVLPTKPNTMSAACPAQAAVSNRPSVFSSASDFIAILDYLALPDSAAAMHAGRSA